MKMKYGSFGERQLQAYRKKLHNKIHWLLVYEDPKSQGNFDNVNIENYIDSLLRELDAFNSLLLQNSEQIVEIACTIKKAEQLLKEEPFDFQTYRHYILGAHTLLDQVKFE